MLIYQPIEVLISVLYLCNTLTTTKRSREESLDDSTQHWQLFPQTENVDINIYCWCCAVSFTQTLNTIMATCIHF